MVPQRRQIPSADLAFTSGETVSQELPTAYVVEGYDLIVKPRIVVAGGATSGNATSEAAQRAFLDTVKIIVNGGRVLRTIKGEELFQYNALMRGTEPGNTYFSGAMGIATHNAELHYHIPARILRGDATPDESIRRLGHTSWSEATSLPTWSYDEITLELTWGTIADLHDATGDRTETLTVPTIELYERYARTESLTPSQQSMAGYGTAMWERKTFTVTAAETEFLAELPRAKGKSISRILVKAVSDDVLVNTIINKITVRGNESVEIQKTLSWSAVRAVNKETYQAEAILDAGYAVIDFMDDKNLGDILDTDAWRKLHVVLDVAHPGTVDQVILLIESVQV